MTSYTPTDEVNNPTMPDRENEIAVTEKLACDRCRQRKIKCDRVNPCSQCTKTESQCTHKLGQKVKPKRQRVLLSSQYETKMEHISKKIDDLGVMMSRLSHERASGSESAGSASLQLPVQTHIRSTQSPVFGTDNKAGARTRHEPVEKAQGIESTLFANVIFATKFLQAVVANDSQSNVAAEMVSVLDTLQSVVNVQKQHNETLEASHPFSSPLPSGLSCGDLPKPSIEKILACLRMAHELSPSTIYWPFEFGSLGDFTEYVIKACSPGPVADMELLIVHYGLYLLFSACSNATDDDMIRQDYEAQSLICRDSLETILSSLSFHIPTSINSVRAMYMASLYCLQRSKPFAAWSFISKASIISQTLGLHSEGSTAEDTAFWALYVLEKTSALRLGVSSTIRDHDITVSRILLDQRMTSFLYNRLPDWINVANLYGRVYDNIYSPSALAHPVAVRESRARALALELEGIMAARVEIYKRPTEWTSQVIEPGLFAFITHANRATDYSILASIYKGIPFGDPSNQVPCPECISAARATLKEADACIAILADVALVSPSLDSWVSEIFLLAPFIPFLILFCNIIQTSDPSDLGHLQRLVDGLQSVSEKPRYSACRRQMRVLKALYDVAAKYIEAKASNQSMDLTVGQIPEHDFNAYLNSHTEWFNTDSPYSASFTEPGNCSAELVQNPRNTSPTKMTGEKSQDVISQMSAFRSGAEHWRVQPEMSNELGMELDTPGDQLGTWLHQSHQMMRLLEDS